MPHFNLTKDESGGADILVLQLIAVPARQVDNKRVGYRRIKRVYSTLRANQPMRMSQSPEFNSVISKGFVLAGLMNMSVIVFSKGFTNSVLSETDPVVASDFGLVMIILWGLAYISVAKTYKQVRWLVAVFAIEKLIYGIVWTNWVLNHDLSAVFSKDLFAGAFFSVYGINDWLFCIFFTVVFFRLSKVGKVQ